MQGYIFTITKMFGQVFIHMQFFSQAEIYYAVSGNIFMLAMTRLLIT